MKAARARGIPVWMLLFSWDNLSTKGALHGGTRPDVRVERAAAPGSRGAARLSPPIASWWPARRGSTSSSRSTPRVPREAFFAPLGLDPARPTLLYLCSSRFIAARELAFIRSWLAALRASPGPLAECNVIVRPHPDVVLVDDEEPSRGRHLAGDAAGDRLGAASVRRPGRPGLEDDLRHAAGVLRVPAPRACRRRAEHQRRARSGIVGRPVYTVLSTGAAADGQANTVHFNYLLREHGGFVHYAADLASHMAQLADSLRTPARHGRHPHVHRRLPPAARRSTGGAGPGRGADRAGGAARGAARAGCSAGA